MANALYIVLTLITLECHAVSRVEGAIVRKEVEVNPVQHVIARYGIEAVHALVWEVKRLLPSLVLNGAAYLVVLLHILVLDAILIVIDIDRLQHISPIVLVHVYDFVFVVD